MKVGKNMTLPALLLFLVVGCQPERGGETETEEARPTGPDSTPTIVLETTMGRIVLELDRTKAPQTVANFETYMRAGFYNGLIFHRVSDGPNVIQTGAYTSTMSRRRMELAFLQNEGGNGLLNVRGSVAMARGRDEHSATSEFFINVGDNPQLNTTEERWGYAVFGRVIDGMDVVDRIKAVPTRQWGRLENVPVEPIVIDSCYVADEAELGLTGVEEETGGGA